MNIRYLTLLLYVQPLTFKRVITLHDLTFKINKARDSKTDKNNYTLTYKA